MVVGYDASIGYDDPGYSYDGEPVDEPCPPAVVVGTSTDGTFTAGGDVTLAIPVGTAGNLLVAGIVVGNGALSTPTGWTLLESISHPSSGGFRSYLFYRVADGSEGGSVFFSYGGRILGALVECSDFDVGAPFGPHGAGNSITASPRTGSIGVGAAVLFADSSIGDLAPPADWTELIDIHSFVVFDDGGEVAYIEDSPTPVVGASWTGDTYVAWGYIQPPECGAPPDTDVGWTLGDFVA